MMSLKCFETNTELRTAVFEYHLGSTANRDLVIAEYGPVIGDWCVDNVENFDRVFQNLTTFNDPLSNWNTIRATSMSGMFQNATTFNQPIDHFVVDNVVNLASMLTNASSFDQNLCSWVASLDPESDVSNMFVGTSCPFPTDPDLLTLVAGAGGPLCQECPAITTTTEDDGPTMAPTLSEATLIPTATMVPSVTPSLPLATAVPTTCGKQTTIYVIEVYGSGFMDTLTPELIPIVDAIIADELSKLVDTVEIFFPGQNITDDRQRLFYERDLATLRTCPASCKKRASRLCVRLNCVRASSGGKRRLRQLLRRLQTTLAPGSSTGIRCTNPDPKTAQAAVDAALLRLEEQCTIVLDSAVDDIDRYEATNATRPEDDDDDCQGSSSDSSAAPTPASACTGRKGDFIVCHDEASKDENDGDPNVVKYAICHVPPGNDERAIQLCLPYGGGAADTEETDDKNMGMDAHLKNHENDFLGCCCAAGLEEIEGNEQPDYCKTAPTPTASSSDSKSNSNSDSNSSDDDRRRVSSSSYYGGGGCKYKYDDFYNKSDDSDSSSSDSSSKENTSPTDAPKTSTGGGSSQDTRKAKRRKEKNKLKPKAKPSTTQRQTTPTTQPPTPVPTMKDTPSLVPTAPLIETCAALSSFPPSYWQAEDATNPPTTIDATNPPTTTTSSPTLSSDEGSDSGDDPFDDMPDDQGTPVSPVQIPRIDEPFPTTEPEPPKPSKKLVSNCLKLLKKQCKCSNKLNGKKNLSSCAKKEIKSCSVSSSPTVAKKEKALAAAAFQSFSKKNCQ